MIHSDEIDQAAALEQQMREAAIKAHVNRARPSLSDGYCQDCGNPIPQSRLQANAYAARCIECQTIFENKDKHVSRI